MTESVTVAPSGQREGEEKRYLIRWKNRQKMAWLAFWFLVFFGAAERFALPVWYNYMDVNVQQWTEHLMDNSIYFYGSFVAIVLGYMGFTTWAIKGNNFTVREEDY